MGDEFDVVHLGEEETQEIINWSVQVGAIMLIMKSYPRHTNMASLLEWFDDSQSAVTDILDNMPVVMRGPVAATMIDYTNMVVEEEAVVAEFVEELKDL